MPDKITKNLKSNQFYFNKIRDRYFDALLNGQENKALASINYALTDELDILKKITNKTKIVFLANPNNPTGTYISKKQLLDLRKRLNDIYVTHTGQDFQVIEEAVERDRYMSPEEAKEFGLIDSVVEKRS